MEDLNAASLADVKDWFRPTTAPPTRRSRRGDVHPEDIKTRVEHYFGDIRPAGVSHAQSWVAKMSARSAPSCKIA